MTPKAKMWMKFVCSRIWPTLEMSEIGPIQAIITYGILQKKQICIGTWKYKNMVNCMDKTMNPPRKLHGNDIFKQFVLLQTKQKEERKKRGLQEDDE
ncbi:hypothetical protein Gotur_030060 [Gossypium turneri]